MMTMVLRAQDPPVTVFTPLPMQAPRRQSVTPLLVPAIEQNDAEREEPMAVTDSQTPSGSDAKRAWQSSKAGRL